MIRIKKVKLPPSAWLNISRNVVSGAADKQFCENGQPLLNSLINTLLTSSDSWKSQKSQQCLLLVLL